MRYKIVVGDGQYDLLNKVNDSIKNGWRPQGGVSYSSSGAFREIWTQAMVKEK